MKYTFEIYNLQLIDAADNTCKTQLSPKEGQAVLKERRKLYIVFHASQVFYVGEANTSIKIRLQRSCSSHNHYIITGKARGGYKGYKWLNKKDNSERNLKIAVAIFCEDYDPDDKRVFIEAIEGELVHLIKQNTGKWPAFQNEIHFSNCQGAKEIAGEILNKTFNEELIQ